MLFHPSSIRVHHGKTQVWNRESLASNGIDVMQAVARIHDPEAIVWRDNVSPPTVDQGVRLLGTPLRHFYLVGAQLASLSKMHDQLLQQEPTTFDLQCAWMMLLCCCAGRANHTHFVLGPSCQPHSLPIMMLRFGEASTHFLGLTQFSVLGPREFSFVIGPSWVAQRNIDVTNSFLVKLGGLFGNDRSVRPCRARFE